MLSSIKDRKSFSEANKLQQNSYQYQLYLVDQNAQISKLGLKRIHDLLPAQVGTDEDTVTPRSPTGADASYANMLKFNELKLKNEEKESTIYGLFKSSLSDSFASDIRTIENDPANDTDKKKTYAIIALMNAKTAATRDATNANLNNELSQLPVVTKHKTSLDTLILFNYFNELYYSNNNNTLYPFDTLKTMYLNKLASDPGSETSLQREAILGTSYTDWNTFYNHFSNYLTTRTALATNSHPTTVISVPTAPAAIPTPIATLGNVNNSTMQPINGYPAPQFANQYNQLQYGMPHPAQRWNTSNQQGGGNSGGRYSPSTRYNSQNRSTRNNNRGYHPYEPSNQMPPNANQSNQSRNQQQGRNGQNMNPSRNNGRQQQQQQYHQNNRNGQQPQQQQQGNRNQNYGNNNNSQDPRNNTLASQFQINSANNNGNQQQSSSNNNEQLVQQILQHSVNRTQFRELDYDHWYDDYSNSYDYDDDDNIVILPVNNTYSDVDDED